ncbi:hypothetical protein AB9H28_23270, partial [Salmonella enterica subsp. enterica serovar Kentucky]
GDVFGSSGLGDVYKRQVVACLVQWEALKGKAIYRVLLILPYAVPSFISNLILKGLLNQSFGEINKMLSALFCIKPAWLRSVSYTHIRAHDTLR